MTWNIEFLEEAKKDMKKLDHSVQLQVVKGMENHSEIKMESILQIS